MAKDKKNIKFNKADIAISAAWLLEAAFRVFVGWTLLTTLDSFIAVVAALYALGTAAAIVASHFAVAHK